MLFRSTIYAGLFSTLLLSGCSLFDSETDVVQMSPLPEIEQQFKVKEVWSTSVGNGVGEYHSHLSPAIGDDVVYAAERDGLVQAMDADSGKRLWKISLADNTGILSISPSALLSGGLTLEGNVLFVSSERGQLFAISRHDGSLIWKTTLAGESLSKPVVAEDLVLVNTSNGMLQAVDRDNGEIKWTASLDMPLLSIRGESSPAIANGAAIIGGNNGRISAVLLEQGQLLWQQRISTPKGSSEISRLSDVDTTPVIDLANQLIYAIAYNGDLVALSLNSGQVLWKRDIGSVNEIILDEDSLFVVDQDSRIVRLSAQGGVVIWTQSELLHRGVTGPLLHKNYLVMGDSEGYLHWLDRDSGRLLAHYKVDSSGLLNSPQLLNGHVVVQSRDGDVYRLEIVSLH